MIIVFTRFSVKKYISFKITRENFVKYLIVLFSNIKLSRRGNSSFFSRDLMIVFIYHHLEDF